MRDYYRQTKIIATLGPATESRERLAEMIMAGVDVVRLNMAHGSGEWVTSVIKRIREVSCEVGRHVAVMMDVKGPEIRTGPLDEAFELKAGDLFSFHTGAVPSGVQGVSVNYPGLPLDVKVGAIVLVDSGLIRLEILDKSE